jgi:hypothetical protein
LYPIVIEENHDPQSCLFRTKYRDPNYRSVKPCRPNGVPMDCCLLDVTNDFQESNPLPTDCDAMELEGKNLFEIEGGCEKDENGAYSNLICLQPGDVKAGSPPSQYTLWSHVGAAGPFTNSKGIPIDGLPMRCICESFDDGVNFDDKTYFTLGVFSPTKCRDNNFLGIRPPQSVRCEGLPVSVGNRTNSAMRTTELINTIASQGVDINDFDIISLAEIRQLLLLVLPSLYRSLNSYLNREGFREWPNILRWPFIYNEGCAAKNATSLAYPPTTFPPYVFGGETELTFPVSRGPLELCAIYTPDNRFFCPSHQNPTLQNVERWEYDRYKPRGIFSNGSTWEPLTVLQCLLKCQLRPEGTAYIGDGPHGILV